MTDAHAAGALAVPASQRARPAVESAGTAVATRATSMATKRSVLSEIVLLVDGSGGVDVGRLQRTFPTVRVHVGRADARPAEVPDVRYEAWHSSTFDFWLFDRRVDERTDEGEPLVLRAPARHASRFAHEVLTRAQRRLDRRNVESRTALFDRVLEAHRALHDLEQSLVRADHDHALDCWQWTLRLDPTASAACQLAALLHDVERLETESVARIEQHAPDHRAFKEAHARGGAPLAAALVRGAGGDEALEREVARLVAASETPGADPDVALINDADALSFFALNSPGFVDYFGAAHARKKIAYTIGRMSARALEELPRVRLRPDVAALVADTLEAPVRQIEAVG